MDFLLRKPKLRNISPTIHRFKVTTRIFWRKKFFLIIVSFLVLEKSYSQEIEMEEENDDAVMEGLVSGKLSADAETNLALNQSY